MVGCWRSLTMVSNVGDTQIGGHFPDIFGVEMRLEDPGRIYGHPLL